MKRKVLISIAMVCALIMAGCSQGKTGSNETVSEQVEETVSNVEIVSDDAGEETEIDGENTEEESIEADGEASEDVTQSDDEVPEAEEPLTNIELVTDLDEAYESLCEGKCDAIALSQTVAEKYVNKADGKLARTDIFFVTNTGKNVVIAKNGETSLIEIINTILKTADEYGYISAWINSARIRSGLDEGTIDAQTYPVDETYMYLLDSSKLKKPDLDLSNTEGVMKDIIDRGSIVIVTSPDFPPVEFKDENDVLYGSEMVLAKYVSDCLGVSLEIKETSFDNVLNLVESGEADIAFSGYAWTQEREDKYELSVEYGGGTAGDTLIVLSSEADNYHYLSDFVGKHIIVQKDSVQQTYVEEQILSLEQ